MYSPSERQPSFSSTAVLPERSAENQIFVPGRASKAASADARSSASPCAPPAAALLLLLLAARRRGGGTPPARRCSGGSLPRPLGPAAAPAAQRAAHEAQESAIGT